MDEWRFSTEALNVLHEYYDVDLVVFVEGKDDIPFWFDFFKSDSVKFYLLEANGIEELNKIMLQIFYEEARVIVACDSHHSPILHNEPEHVRIVRTYGYSIENTMYCPRTISAIISKHCRDVRDRSKIVLKWMNEFTDGSKILLIYDVANHKYGKSLKVFGDNCCPFLKSNHSHELSTNKILAYCDRIKDSFEDEELAQSETLINIDEREPRYLVKGDFLTHGVLNIIKNVTRKNTSKSRGLTIPLESLYALTVDSCHKCTNEVCIEKEAVKERVEQAVSSIKD